MKHKIFQLYQKVSFIFLSLIIFNIFLGLPCVIAIFRTPFNAPWASLFKLMPKAPPNRKKICKQNNNGLFVFLFWVFVELTQRWVGTFCGVGNRKSRNSQLWPTSWLNWQMIYISIFCVRHIYKVKPNCWNLGFFLDFSPIFRRNRRRWKPDWTFFI